MNDDAFDVMSDWRPASLNGISNLFSLPKLAKTVTAYGLSSHATMPFKGRWIFLQEYCQLLLCGRVFTWNQQTNLIPV